MTFAVLLGLFFGGFAAGSLHTAKQDYRWRDAFVVRGVLVKKGSLYHYEYARPGEATVIGPTFTDDSSNKPDGIVDDWVRLEYDPKLPEHLRPHLSKGRAGSNYAQFAIELVAGSIFAAASASCVWVFLRALYDKRQLAETP